MLVAETVPLVVSDVFLRQEVHVSKINFLLGFIWVVYRIKHVTDGLIWWLLIIGAKETGLHYI